jgi:hypothetical protein
MGYTRLTLSFSCRDQNDDQYQQYLSTMPWYAYPHSRAENNDLGTACGVETIPSLTLLDSDGSVLTHKAADLLRKDPSGADWPYRPRPIEQVSDADAAIINSARCCVCFVDSREEQRALAEKVLLAAAEAEFRKPSADRCLFFFLADASDSFVQRLMEVRAFFFFSVLFLASCGTAVRRTRCRLASRSSELIIYLSSFYLLQT